LNRNFPTGWQESWKRTGCWQLEPITAGQFPLSEPETFALAQFLRIHNIEALLSYHSAGLGIFPGGQPEDEDSRDLATAIANRSPFAYPPVDTGCQYTGSLADYAIDIDIAAIDLELTTHWDTELDENLVVLQVLLSWEPDQQIISEDNQNSP
jgi:hypothetical protein